MAGYSCTLFQFSTAPRKTETLPKSEVIWSNPHTIFAIRNWQAIDPDRPGSSDRPARDRINGVYSQRDDQTPRARISGEEPRRYRPCEKTGRGESCLDASRMRAIVVPVSNRNACSEMSCMRKLLAALQPRHATRAKPCEHLRHHAGLGDERRTDGALASRQPMSDRPARFIAPPALHHAEAEPIISKQ